MLAQNFKTAADLGISEIEHGALIAVLGMLERGECHGFSMYDVYHRCQSPMCILGWARHIADDHSLFDDNPKSLCELFYPDTYGPARARKAIECTDQETAALALRSYLTTGEANWAEALA